MPTATVDPIRSMRPSLRPEATAEIAARTGLNEAMLDQVVRAFYARVRDDDMLGPIFERIADWEPHLARMTAFWSSVALMTGNYHGRPLEKHLPLPVEGAHFARWLALFEETAREICTPEGAAHLIERAHRIARSIHMAIADARDPGGPPRLFP
jgi:hemoglobin